MSGLRIGSLFSGYGGLDLAVEQVTGATTAWVSDIDKGAFKILAHRRADVPSSAAGSSAPVRCSSTGWNSSVGEKSTYSLSSRASGA